MVPALSTTWAMMPTDPLEGTTLVEEVSVIVEPVGARSGTFSQATAAKSVERQSASRTRAESRVNMKTRNMLRPKRLVGQAKFAASEQGYAMAALLVALSVMAVLMTAAMPVWKQVARREKEEEVIFRGQQYARAIGLFQRRAGPGVLPPSIDTLTQGKFLRKKYKDPITGQDFDLLGVGTNQPGQTPGAPGGG